MQRITGLTDLDSSWAGCYL